MTKTMTSYAVLVNVKFLNKDILNNQIIIIHKDPFMFAMTWL